MVVRCSAVVVALDMIEATLNKRMSAGEDSPTPKQRGGFRR